MKIEFRLLSSTSRLALAMGMTASLSVFAALPATAQTATTTTNQDEALVLDTIEVEAEGEGEGGYAVEQLSSPKQTAPLLDTPQTVNVIPQEVIRETGARTLTEVIKNTPGISFNSGENGFGTTSNNFQLRGFDASGDIFVDGSRDSGSYTRDSFNMQQVEVFKGPAADNGRSNAGGYVNIETKTPGMTDFVFGSVGYGFDEYDSDARRRATIDSNHVIAANTAIRLNAVFEDSGVAGRDMAEANVWGTAPSIAFGLGTEFRTVLAFEHVERTDLPDWGLPGAAFSDIGSPDGQAAFDPTLAGMPQDNFFGLSTDFDDVTSDSLLARFEYDLTSAATISNQTRYEFVDRLARYTVPTGNAGGGRINTQTQFYDRENTSITNLTNLSYAFSTGSLTHNLATGIEIARETSDAAQYNTLNPGQANAFDPNPNRSAAAPLVPASTAGVEVTTVAAYAYDTVEFNPRWQVTGGVRVESYEAEIDSSLPLFNGSQNYSEDDVLFGGKVGLVYKPARNGSVYVAVSSSQDPHSSFLSNPDISRTGGNAFPGFIPGVGPVTSYNYELGTKWDLLDDRLLLTGALFHTEKQDVPVAPTGFLIGYQDEVVQGVEMSAAGQITEEWGVFAGLLLMQSERQLDDPASIDAFILANNPGDYGTATTSDGDELAFTPNVSANLWTTYRFPIGLTLGGGVRYVGSSYLGRPDDALRIVANGTFGELPSYTTVNLMAAYDITENVDVRLNIDNVLDETYIVTSNWNGRRVQLGDPRTFMLTTSFSF